MIIQNHSFSTYTKLTVSQYKSLRELIHAITPLPGEKQRDTKELLTEKQLNEALSGPYGRFISLTIKHCAILSKLMVSLNLTGDSFFKTKRVNIEKELALPGHLRNFPPAKTNAILRKLNEATEKNYKNWQMESLKWQEAILATLNKIDINLSNIEIKDLKRNETFSELLSRFTEFKITMPPKMKTTECHFRNYFFLKSYLAIHNALNRQQIAHDQSAILQYLQKLKKPLDQITKQEKNLLTQQQKELEKITKEITFN